MYVGVLMKTVTSEDLNRILEDHYKWIKSSGNDGIQANLVGADLGGADLAMADLRAADLHGADLRGADLRGADLRGANISMSIACPEEGSFIGFKKSSR